MIQLRNSTSGQTAWFPKITKETVDSYTKTESDARYVKKTDYDVDIKDINKQITDINTEISNIPTEFKTINGETITGDGDIEINATIDSGSDLTVNTLTTASGDVDTRIASNTEAIQSHTNQIVQIHELYRKKSDSYSRTEVYTSAETNTRIDEKINQKIWTGTQSQYDALSSYDGSTIYVITE